MFDDYVTMNEKFARYPISGYLTLSTFFPNGVETAKKYIKRKKEAKGDLQDIYGTHDRTMLVRIIFHTFLNKIVDKLIDDKMFKFPGTTKTVMVVKSYPDLDIKRMRQKGKYKDIDLTKTYFKIPHVVVDFGPYTSKYDYGVYIGKEKDRELIKRAENGLISWIKIPKTLDRDVRNERCDDGDL